MQRLSDPGMTRKVISQYDFDFRKRFGQNFLVDEGVILRALEAARVSKEDVIIEIGPGKTIAGFVKKTIPEIPVINVSSVEDIAKVKEALNG